MANDRRGTVRLRAEPSPWNTPTPTTKPPESAPGNYKSLLLVPRTGRNNNRRVLRPQNSCDQHGHLRTHDRNADVSPCIALPRIEVKSNSEACIGEPLAMSRSLASRVTAAPRGAGCRRHRLHRTSRRDCDATNRNRNAVVASHERYVPFEIRRDPQIGTQRPKPIQYPDERQQRPLTDDTQTTRCEPAHARVETREYVNTRL